VVCFHGEPSWAYLYRTMIGPLVEGEHRVIVPAYEAPFTTAESKAGAAQFPLLLPTSGDAVGAKQMLAISNELSRWKKPALIAFSDMDPVFPTRKPGRSFATSSGPRAPRSRSRVRPTSFKKTAGHVQPGKC
jgi:hypothetical protein